MPKISLSKGKFPLISVPHPTPPPPSINIRSFKKHHIFGPPLANSWTRT